MWKDDEGGVRGCERVCEMDGGMQDVWVGCAMAVDERAAGACPPAVPASRVREALAEGVLVGLFSLNRSPQIAHEVGQLMMLM